MSEPVRKRSVIISSDQGLHARPAQLLARLALQFKSDIDLVLDSQRVDAKSILHLLTLGAERGTTLTIEAQGADAESAIDALAQLVESGFALEEETVGQDSPEIEESC